MRALTLTFIVSCVLVPCIAHGSAATLRGKYLEVRSCDVYTGYCFANGEMSLAGHEAILVWTVTEGAWKGVPLDGLSVIAIIKADGTLGDLADTPVQAQSALIVDERATAMQRDALMALAAAGGGDLLSNIVEVTTSPIESSILTCRKRGCAAVRAGDLVEVSTRCLNDHDLVCGNEEVYYPPLTAIDAPQPAAASFARFTSRRLDLTWADVDRRGAYLGVFQY